MMTWTLLATIAATLSLNIGLTSNNIKTREQFDKVEVQAQTDNGVIEVTKTIGPAGGSIAIPYNGKYPGIHFEENALLRDVEITVKLIEEPATNYSSELNKHPIITELDWANKVKVTGPQIIIELPLDALNWHDLSSLRDLFTVILVHYDASPMDKVEDIEVRAYDASNQITNGFEFSYYGSYLVSNGELLRLIDYYNPPSILRISVQPTDFSDIYDNDPDNSYYKQNSHGIKTSSRATASNLV